MRRLLLATLLVASALASKNASDSKAVPRKKYKFLAYSPQFANSHVNFMGKISDALVDAGHHVTMISPLIDRNVGTTGTKKANVIEIPQSEKAKIVESFMAKAQQNMWNVQSVWGMLKSMDDFEPILDAWASMCNDTASQPGLMDWLREQHFDVAYTEAMDFCAFGLFHLAGIEKYAVTQSLALMDGTYFITQTPTMASYVPSTMGGYSGEKMTFFERMSNLAPSVLFDYFLERNFIPTQTMFEKIHPDFPSLKELAAKSSLVFLNSEPLVDFPRVTTHRIVEIGGIVVNGEHGRLNKTWSDIMDLRPRTVLLSFGSFAKAYLMPEEYKKTIRDTLAKFPDVTFIWKYEKPEDNVSGGVANIIESTWVPQVDMLYDPRLTAFITHCGQGSTTEANMAGVPLLVIPVAADQLRNAQQVKRNGVGMMLDKALLSSPGPFEEAIKELLERQIEFRANAERLSKMVADRPFKIKEIFVRNMEFLAEYGPLRMLDHEGRNLNFFQFYLIDVFAFVTGIVLVVLSVVALVARFVMKKLLGFVRIDKKKDIIMKVILEVILKVFAELVVEEAMKRPPEPSHEESYE